jgi:nucleoside-diphosphate-sugar epimerase
MKFLSGFYAGRRVLITGGLGFIGSNLALRLATEGAKITVLDPCVPGCGGSPYNLEGAGASIRVLPLDIGSPEVPVEVIRESQVIFNLAGEVSHTASMRMPERDLSINTMAQLRFLQAVVAANTGVRIVYAGTRQVYGVPEYLPVDEDHPIHPVDFNGIHKYAATMYHLMFTQAGLLDACVLQLTNGYGPRLSLDVPNQGVLGNFVRKLSRGERLTVYGDGNQLRDPVFVDDVVEAFLLVGARNLRSRIYNIGGPEAMKLREIAIKASEAAGVEPPTFCEFPSELKSIDIGSYVSDRTRILQEFGWQPTTPFAEGIVKTLAYYRGRYGVRPDRLQVAGVAAGLNPAELQDIAESETRSVVGQPSVADAPL